MSNQKTLSPHAGQKNSPGQRVDFNKELSYFEAKLQKESYYVPGNYFSDYEAAYRTGFEGHSKYVGKRFEDVEQKLKSSWEGSRGDVSIDWQGAKQAVRAAWNYMEDVAYADASS